MTRYLKGAVARLALALLVLSALGGCAVYGPAPGPYVYSGTDANGQPVYVAPPVYAAPYYYGPAYVGPPISLNFGFGYWGGRGGRGGFRGGGGRGGWGHGGGHGGGGHR